MEFCSAKEENFNSSSSRDDFSILFLCPFYISCLSLPFWGSNCQVQVAVVGDGIKLNAVVEGRHLMVHGTRAARAKAWLV